MDSITSQGTEIATVSTFNRFDALDPDVTDEEILPDGNQAQSNKTVTIEPTQDFLNNDPPDAQLNQFCFKCKKARVPEPWNVLCRPCYSAHVNQ